MARITSELIRKLRDSTGAPILRVKKVLDEVIGNLPEDATHQALRAGEEKAEKILRREGFAKAAKRSERETGQGVLKAYTHHSGKIVSVVELLCETDFVAKNEIFQTLANDLALQVASMNAKDVAELTKQDFVKNPSRKVRDLVKETIAKTGENVRIGRVFRIELGKNE